MERGNSNRTRKFTLRLTSQEYKEIESGHKESTCLKMSDYVRKLLFNKPITKYYRNQSLDNFTEETIMLRKELSAVGNNLNQVVKKMHTLQQISEFRQWIIAFEIEKKILSNKMMDIQNQIHKIVNKWSQ